MCNSRSELLALIVIAAISLTSACQPALNSNANSNANSNSQSANANSVSSNANLALSSGPTINAREPAKYSATLVFTIETEGREKAIGIPPLSVKVARNVDDRRLEFNLPDGTPLIYVDHNNHHYVIVPSKKQYAELTPEATGIQPQKLMTPGQLVESLKNVKGVERLGAETIDGRAADKYGYTNSTNTNTQAGQVNTQAFVYVDKETGLPLRSELVSESSGELKGVKGARVVAEMRDIKTEIEPALFEVPAGYNQVAPERIRQQVDAVTTAIGAVLKTMIGGLNSPASSPSPTGSPQSK
jgi:hypothetical protein